MTVQELIDKLNLIQDKSQIVEVSVHQYNKAYPVAYLQPWNHSTRLQNNGHAHRIEVSLPETEDHFTGVRSYKK